MPDKPGVYFFIEKGKILYIGKATSLRSRVRSYFGKDLIATRGPLIVDMVFKSKNIKWQETDSVLEALILEANLIKKHQPYYNTKEKDDKSFLTVVITKEAMPQVLSVRTRELTENKDVLKGLKIWKTYGPFTNGRQLAEALKIIRRIFPYRDDKSSKRDNYEFYKQLGLSPDENISNEEYLKTVKNISLFFEGKKKRVLLNLKKEMKKLAKEKRFEEAAKARNQMFALQHINDVALIKEDRIDPVVDFGNTQDGRASHLAKIHYRVEAYDIAHMSGKNMAGVMVVVEGDRAVKSEYRLFKIRSQEDANDTGALVEVLERRLKHDEWPAPGVIVVDGSTAQLNAANGVLLRMGLKIPIVAVVKDERHKPKGITGPENLVKTYKKGILLANSEAHRFAINYHKKLRGKNFIPTSLKLRRTRK